MGNDSWKPPVLRLAATHTGARTYHLRGVGDRDQLLGGWALCTVNDKTGELIVVSDWGNWAYRWDASPRNLGERTFTEFLAEPCTWTGHDGKLLYDEYIANKLTSRAEREAFDDQATADALCHLIAARRLEDGRDERAGVSARYGAQRLDAETAREFVDEIQRLVGEHAASEAAAELFLARLFETLKRLDAPAYGLLDEPWNHLEYRPTYPYRVLKEAIIPALVEACRQTVVEQRAAGASAAEVR